MKYRAEIDGLRAIAVVPVILFHAGFGWFRGGFIGVDIFFVISGYLITTILVNDLENGTFSFINFYERRARRILPALYFVCLVCIPLAWIFMFPSQMYDFSKSLVAVSLFVSNIFFWKESNYFSLAAGEKPLLHTWSLAVEEQYYLLFPLFLFLVWRFGRKRVLWLIVVLALISLALSEWSWRNHIEANFFFLHTRAWELLAGAIAAFIVRERGVQANEFLSSLGFVAILIAIFSYHREIPIPGIYALMPVIGAVLVIMYAGKETFVARLLSAKGLVAIGLISYSAYLWHQPVFAFAKIIAKDRPPVSMMLALSILSLALAWFSWKYIETPFRNRTQVLPTKFVKALGSAFAVILAFGLFGERTDGLREQMFAYKYPTSQTAIYRSVLASTKYDFYKNMASKDCRIWVPNTDKLDEEKLDQCFAKFGSAIVILGDSHAMNLFNAVSQSEKLPFVIGVARPECRIYGADDDCQYRNFEKFLKTSANKIKGVVYHQSGSYFVEDKKGKVDSQDAFEGDFGGFKIKAVDATITYLAQLSSQFSLPVLWLGPFLEYRENPLAVLGTEKLNRVNPKSMKIFKKLDHVLLEKVNEAGTIRYANFSDMFFEPELAFYDDCFVFRDEDHYSQCGERLIAKKSRIENLESLLKPLKIAPTAKEGEVLKQVQVGSLPLSR